MRQHWRVVGVEEALAECTAGAGAPAGHCSAPVAAMFGAGVDSGAHFRRCDFQVHTPRDAQWKGRRPTVEERPAYAARFVGACRRIGLDAVAITDHHDLVLAPLIRQAAREEVDANGNLLPPERQLVVFPGIELTLGQPTFQALLLLDADLPEDRLPLVLEALAITQCPPDELKLPAVTSVDHIKGLQQLYDTLSQRDWLRGRFIVFPNVTDSGHKTLMRTGMQSEYRDMPCIGGYLDGSVEKIGTGNRNKFDGADQAWGNKPLTLFQTSDSRSDDFSNLGRHSTWVKWVAPTAEALRQACLSRQSRVSQTEPRMPAVFISRLSVSNSRFMGPVEVSLNRQYNALIGGRGTGKSTLLDYLRWALGDQPSDAADGELANPAVRRRQLIDATLRPAAGQVEVHFSINGIEHVVRRNAQTDELLLKVGDGPLERVRDADVQSLLPIHAYSQKQLSGVALREDELMRFVTAPVAAKLDDVDRRVREAAGQLRENYATLQRARQLDSTAERSMLAERSLSEQAANLRRTLRGLEPEDQALLEAKPDIDRLRERANARRRDADNFSAAVGQLLTLLTQVPADLPDVTASSTASAPAPADEAAALTARYEQEQVAAVTALREAVSVAAVTFETALGEDSELGRTAAALRQTLRDFDERYEAVKGRSTAHSGRLTELAELERRRQDAADLLGEQLEARQSLGEPQARHDALRSALIELYSERFAVLAEQCDRLTAQSEGLLRASVHRGRGLTAAEVKFRALIAGSGVRGARTDELFARLQDESDPIASWEEVLVELERLLLFDGDADHTTELTPVLSRLGFPLADQVRIRSRMTPDGWLDLALTALSDTPKFEYQSKEGEFIVFNAASAGQQATALLRVLLAQSGMPLIIDQPEEDLDSQVIEDVVERVWDAKTRRQIIFASHNANLVVNGDAELVVACAYRRAGDQSGGQIKVEGAIDVAAVRDEITHVMEGGERAFRLRKAKYGF